MFEANGVNVIHSHISEGKDFFSYEPSKPYDFIVSNPPFSLRNEVLERLYALGKPFAILMNQTGIFDSRIRYDVFKKNGVELLVFRGRTCFTNAITGKSGTPAFQSLYVCHGVLPVSIVLS